MLFCHKKQVQYNTLSLHVLSKSTFCNKWQKQTILEQAEQVWIVSKFQYCFWHKLGYKQYFLQYMHHEFQPLFPTKREITGERNKLYMTALTHFIGTSVNKNALATAKYSFATVLINKCFAIKNKWNTTHVCCMYYKKLFSALLNEK